MFTFMWPAPLQRIQERDILYWADPQMQRPREINSNHGGRGVYFDDPAGHHLEAITRRYGNDLA